MTPVSPPGRRSASGRPPLSRLLGPIRRRLLLLPLLLAGAAGTAVAAAHLGGGAPSPRWSAPSGAAADTVPIFGPRRLEAGQGRAAMHVERFAAAAPEGTAFVLRVVDGDGLGNGRVSALSLRVNGAEVATAASLGRAGGTLDVAVALLGQNTIEASVEGPAGAGVSLVVLRVPEPSFTLFGPKTVQRAAGTPAVVTERFPLPAGAAGPYRLHVVNGAADGSARTPSATIRVNGVQVVGPSDLSRNVGALLREVPLAAENRVEVEIRGAPGSRLTWRVTAMDTAAPRITLAAPAADLVTREAQVEVSGTVEDATPASVTVNGAAAARSGTGFRATVPLSAEGTNTLTVSAVDAAGNRTDSVRTVIRDTEAPALAILSPAEGEAAADSIIEVRGTVRDRSTVQANVNGVPVTLDADGAFAVRVPVGEGNSFLTLAATDAAGNAASLVRPVIRDTRAPELALTSPAEGLVTKESSVTVTGTATDVSAVTVTVNGVQASRDPSGAFRADVPLAADGPTVLQVVAADGAGNTARAERRVVRDTQAPVLTLAAPAEGLVTRESAVTVSGRVEDATAVALTLGGAPLEVGADGGFTASAPLAADGPAALALVATDAAGNRAELVRTVIRDTQAPALSLASPADGQVTREGQAVVEGTVTDASAITLTVNGAPASLSDGGAFRVEAALAEGENAIAVRAVDAAGNEVSLSRKVVRDSEAPAIELASPTDGQVTRDAQVVVQGRVTDAGTVTLTVNGASAAVGQGGAFRVEAALAEGENAIAIRAVDAAGNEVSLSRKVVRDSEAPAIELASPTDGQVTREGQVVVQGRVTDAGAVTLTVNGAPAAVGEGGAFRVEAALAEGENAIAIRAVDAAGNEVSLSRKVVRDSEAPAIELVFPVNGAVVRTTALTVTGRVRDSGTVQLTVNGTTAQVDADGAFSAALTLAEGTNAIEVHAVDQAGNEGRATAAVVLDTQAPAFQALAPADGIVVRDDVALVSGRVVDATTVAVTVNGVPATLAADGSFQASVALAEGETSVVITLADAAGNEASAVVRIVRDSQAPVITVASPADGTATEAATITLGGTVTDATAVTLTVNGAAVEFGANGAFTLEAPLVTGANAFAFEATDAAGNTATVTRTVTREEEDDTGLPPDPSRVASPIDPTVATHLGQAAAFLYSGENPIQTGVAPGTIVEHRTAVLRGRVLTRDGAPLSGVRVTVADHPEFGATLSRRDGAYDLAVNGGGGATLQFEKEGYLPAQRATGTAWLEFAGLEDVALVPLDTRVTAVTLTAATAEAQVARGSVVTDGDGPRQATLLFSPGTEAFLELPDGTTRPLSTLSIRATEYTVGAGGPTAMPGLLPGTSGYTYAVELSADEAIAAGAEHARFSKPVKFYVDNFLDFPVGGIVPVAYYDRDKAAWVPMDNGRIIRVLPGGGAPASVDINGDGAADGDAALAALGIDATERAELARTYPEGASLWRVQTTHFSPFDLNWPSGTSPRPRPGPRPPRRPPPDECGGRRSGSIIECEGRVLGEQLTVAGTEFTLNYRSDRVIGRGNETVIPLTGDSIDSLMGVAVEVFVAGRRLRQEFQAAPNLSWAFRWDGLDAYGRRPQGRQSVRVRRTYTYPNYYQVPAAQARSFGLTCTQPMQGGLNGMVQCIIPATINERARQTATESDEFTFEVNQWDGRQGSVAGWTLSDHHVYDPTSRRLYMGTGERRTASRIGQSIETIAGNGEADYTAGDGDALQTPLEEVGPIAVGPDGTIYVAGWERTWLARVTRDGRVEHVAGSRFDRCRTTPCGDGGPISQAGFHDGIEDLKFGPDGSLYIADGTRIRRMSPDGIITTVAGTWNWVRDVPASDPAGEGGPAVDARIGYAWGVSVAQDGTIYFVDSGNWAPVTRVRKVTPDGIIHTVAGGLPYTGENAPCRAEGIAATAACLDFATDVDVAPDGTVYVLEPYNRLMKVTPEGTFERVAGSEALSCWGTDDGLPALETGLCGWRMERHPDGRIFFDDQAGAGFYADSVNWEGYVDNSYRMRAIGLDGIVTTVFGGNGWCRYWREPRCGDGGLAAGAQIGWMPGLSFGPDGATYIGDMELSRVRRIGLPFPGYDETSTFIASTDGEEVYELDAAGRHVRTRDARLGVVHRAFGYDGEGRLASITDEEGETTRVERDGAGRVTALVAPGGDRTVLAENADGYLASVTTPAGQTVRLEYAGPGGLMTALVDPRGGRHAYAYDDIGRLGRDTDPADGFQVVDGFTTRNCGSAGCQEGTGARALTASGRATSYWTQRRDDGAVVREVTSPTGLTWSTTTAERGSTTLRSPDGTLTTSLLAADPRFGMDVPYAREVQVRTPGGLSMVATQSRHVVRDNLADPFSLRTQTDSVEVNGRVFTTVYDRVARQVTRTTAEGRVTVTRLDSLGRMTESRAAGLAPATFSYDAQGRLSRAAQGGRQWEYGYDARGRLTSVTDPLLRTAGYVYDDADRLVTEVTVDGREIHYGYDESGSLVSLTPASRPAHRITLGALDLTASYTPAGEGDGAASFTYNSDRELTRISRPDGSYVGFGYDGGGRLRTVTTPAGEIAYAYSAASGQVVSVTAPGSVLTYAYDGALPTRATLSGVVSGRIDLAYDNDLRITRQTVNGGHEVDFRYDDDGLLTGAGALTAVRHAENGLLAKTVLGAVADSLSYDPLGQVSETRASVGAAELLRARYTRDLLGRITGLEEVVGGETVAWGYTYDPAGRLATVTRDGAPFAAYEYDENGNRLRAVSQAGVLAGAYDAQDRLVSYGAAEYRYGAAGDLSARIVEGDTTRYAYDPLGNLRTVDAGGTRIEYLVDGQNRRIGKRVNGALVAGFLYAGSLNPVAQVDASGEVVARFVYATQVNVPDYLERDGRTYRIVSDIRGSVRLVVDDATGAVAQRMDYDAYGRVILDSNPGFQPFGFAGGLYDADTRLVRFGARDYDPETGRWTSRDPIGFSGGDTNLYGYAYGDPVNVIDPDGRCGIAGALGGAALGGAIDLGSQLYNNGGNLSCVSWRQAGGAAAMGGAEGGLTCGLGRAYRALQAGRQMPTKLYHYTTREGADAIMGSQLGRHADDLVYMTPNGRLSPTQAQIELALPSRNTAEVVLEISSRALDPSLIVRRPVTGNVMGPVAGGTAYGRGGGGVELVYNGQIPSSAIRVVP
jgi:RHS repeat-associated protein